MPIYDVTLDLHPDMLVWPGDPAPEVSLAWSIQAGDGSNVTALSISAHAGTHVDAPRHFFDGGLTVDLIPAETLIGEADLKRG